MTIERVNSALPTTDKIEDINDMVIELDGKTTQANFDRHEVEALYSGTGLQRKYIRYYNLSASTGSNAWYNWTWLKDETGYSIWRYDGSINYLAESNNVLYIDDKNFDYQGTATSESITTFDSVFTYDGSIYTDNTSEAGTEGGTEFSVMADTSSYLYIGDDSTFSGIDLNLQTRGSNYTLVFEYYNGSAWTTLLTTDDLLVDNTSNFRRDGSITFTTPSNWATVAVDSTTRYWIRISTTSTPVTTAKVYSSLPYESVPSLLALTSADLTNENWAFCDYGNKMYATFRNSGDTTYEGNWYVTSSSTHSNKQNFFRFNHTLRSDYRDIRYHESGAGLHIKRADGDSIMTLEDTSGGANEVMIDCIGTANTGTYTGSATYIKVKYNGLTRYLELLM